MGNKCGREAAFSAVETSPTVKRGLLRGDHKICLFKTPYFRKASHELALFKRYFPIIRSFVPAQVSFAKMRHAVFSWYCKTPVEQVRFTRSALCWADLWISTQVLYFFAKGDALQRWKWMSDMPHQTFCVRFPIPFSQKQIRHVVGRASFVIVAHQWIRWRRKPIRRRWLMSYLGGWLLTCQNAATSPPFSSAGLAFREGSL